jgi:hypothetical protein
MIMAMKSHGGRMLMLHPSRSQSISGIERFAEKQVRLLVGQGTMLVFPNWDNQDEQFQSIISFTE